MSQVIAKSGSVKSYYSWRVQNPNEVFYDVMLVVDAQESESVYIGWNDEAEKNARNMTSSSSNETIIASALYGAVVGVESGQNEFSVSYVDSDVPDSADLHSGHLLPVFATFVILICNYF